MNKKVVGKMEIVECAICCEDLNKDNAITDKGIDSHNEEYSVCLCKSCAESYKTYRDFTIWQDLNANYW